MQGSILAHRRHRPIAVPPLLRLRWRSAVMSNPNVVQTLARFKPYSMHSGMCSAPYDRHSNFERSMGTHNEPKPNYPSAMSFSHRRGRCGDIGWNHQRNEHDDFKARAT